MYNDKYDKQKQTMDEAKQIINALSTLHEKRTNIYKEAWGEDEWQHNFICPNYDYEYFDKLDEAYELEQNKLNEQYYNDYQDYDNAIKYYIETAIYPTIVQDGNKIEVPIMYGSPERWQTARQTPIAWSAQSGRCRWLGPQSAWCEPCLLALGSPQPRRPRDLGATKSTRWPTRPCQRPPQ